MVKTMPIDVLISEVSKVCRANGVAHLKLFGSFATGTAHERSDIDFVVYGCPDIIKLEDDLEQIETVRKIDVFDFDNIRNEYILEDIEKYGKQIY